MEETELFDRSLAVMLLIVLSPILLVRAALALLSRKLFISKPYRGKAGKEFNLLFFNNILFPGTRLAHLFNIVRGDLAFVGPSFRESQGLDEQLPETQRLLSVRPGIFSPADLRRKLAMDHEGRMAIELEWISNRSIRGNLTLLLRTLISRILYGDAKARAPDKISFFGIVIKNTSMDVAVADILEASKNHPCTVLQYVNPHCLNTAYKNEEYRQALLNADCILPDGSGINLGCRMKKIALKGNLNGTDLFPKLCEAAQESGQSLFLLGGEPGIAASTAENMQAQYPNLKISGTHHGFFDDEDEVIDLINGSGTDILLVAMGVPMQELWIENNRDKLEVGLAMGVGGLFDFYSGRISRAPIWLREIGFEWVWRILQEPGRMWRRYVIGNPLFMWRVWMEARNEPFDSSMLVKKKDGGYDLAVLPPSRTVTQRNLLLKNLRIRANNMRRARWRMRILFHAVFKRLMDISAAFLLILLLTPVFALVAMIIKLESPGPVFFSQKRVGRGAITFDFYKFRSMYTDAEERKKELMEQNEMQGGVIFKMKDDPRVTRVGKFIRKYSIDELPQLYNVLRGDMSLVGPRPPVPSEVEEYTVSDRRRLDSIPGITGLWQVSGRSEIPFDQQVEMDVQYIYSATLWENIKLLFKTIPAVLAGKGAY